MISFITAGRNDDYGKGFLDRFYFALVKNLESIEKLNIEYEYLIVEWCPIKEYFIYEKSKFSSLFKKYPNLVDIVVRSDVNLKENMPAGMFHEYFAKNVGIRQSKYDNLVILNGDILIPFNTMKVIVETIQEGLNKKQYYRPRWRAQLDNSGKELRRGAVNIPARPEHQEYMNIHGDMPGDLFFVDKNTLINYGKGYDETNYIHRNISQINMDGEIMRNMWKRGCEVNYLECEYGHLEHEISSKSSTRYTNLHGYENKPNWGFVDYKKRKISENLIEISWI